MTADRAKTVLFLAAFLAAGSAALPASAATEAAPSQSGARQSAALPAPDSASQPQFQRGTTGIYDRYDRYEDAQGFPLQGFQQLRGAS